MTRPENAGIESRIDPLEPPYRSRGEAHVGRILDRYGIPFFYEQPTLIYDRGRYRVWRPDFTLPQQGGLIVEYAGMMDVPDYARGIAHKRQSYAANALDAMFVFPWDIERPQWPETFVADVYRIESSRRRVGYTTVDGSPYEPGGVR